VPATGDERRYAVNAVSDARRGDRAYFTALYAELNNGGIEALLYDLLHTDLKDWHPRQIYETEALREQKVHSLSGEEEWLEEVLQEGAIPAQLEKHPDRANARELARDARDRVPKIRYMSETRYEPSCVKLELCNPDSSSYFILLLVILVIPVINNNKSNS